MKTMMRLIMLCVLVSLFFGSCTINKNLLFRTDRDHQFDPVPEFDSLKAEFRINPNDVITMALFSNGGGIILENTTTSAERARPVNPIQLEYFVDSQGYVELPILGRQYLAGLTLNEAQDMLAELYSSQYLDPYVLVRVINRRIMVFQGAGGEGKVVALANPRVSVIEALAMAGGVLSRGNASKVKLIRKVGDRQEIYRIDLSRIEGVKYANMLVESGDIIYVDPVPNIPGEVLQDLQPIFQLVTGFMIAYFLITR